ncbi:class I glutamine amidotransferase-like protein [Mycena metata]|uniref:D-lactate dehydratase n=1 Tax=Mycena metata TaxID=1033252 RepID=A0AAD7HUH7_9AGAR|nr:class I glutamine amidotransferase-like protein [Mycena metata]
MPSALILLADGTEEMEFTITYDTLVRAGIACCSAYVQESSGSEKPLYATGSRGIRIVSDTVFDEQTANTSYDVLVIPGGAKGAEIISTNTAVQALVREFLEQDKIVGMICAGSLTALSSKLPRQPLTSHPSVKAQLENDFDYSEQPVVVSKNLVTRYVVCTLPRVKHQLSTLCIVWQSRPRYFPATSSEITRLAGTAFPFALTLVELLCGADKRAEVRAPMVFPADTPF